MLKRIDWIKIALALVFFAFLSLQLNWQFAVTLMVSLGFHESGHVWAMRRCGLGTKGFYFVPFLGGMAVQNQPSRSYADDVFILWMGPFWGLVLALATFVVYQFTGLSFLAAVVVWMCLLNLFNLLPAYPLDGGQILESIYRSLRSRFLFWMLLIITFVTVAALVWWGIVIIAVFLSTFLIDLWRYEKARIDYEFTLIANAYLCIHAPEEFERCRQKHEESLPEQERVGGMIGAIMMTESSVQSLSKVVHDKDAMLTLARKVSSDRWLTMDQLKFVTKRPLTQWQVIRTVGIYCSLTLALLGLGLLCEADPAFENAWQALWKQWWK